MSCRECGAAELVHDDVGGFVCTRCGTLADAVLDNRDDHPSTIACAVAPRTSKGWRLAHTKQDRDRKNTIAMSTFIHSVLSRLSDPGLSPRAQVIFTQAMAKGHFRWGRKAKLVAGASIAIALREAHKSDSLRDIAFLLDDSTVSLARAFQSVVSLLSFSLASVGPAVHLPTLRAHLQSIIHSEVLSPSPSPPPKALVSVLSSLSLPTAVRTATSLSQIISDHSPPLTLTNLPTPPTACALLILGLEAEARVPLPHLGELARTLGSRFALSPGVVSSRYKLFYDLIEEWIRHVPWLDQFDCKGKGRGAAARSKVSKRAIVAKGIKDVIQFHEEIWFSRIQNQQKVNLGLKSDLNDFANEQGDSGDSDGIDPSIASSSRKNINESTITLPPERRRKAGKKGDAMQVASRHMFDPLSPIYRNAPASNDEISPLTHMLTRSPNELLRAQENPPTRLQLLVASRGGSTEKFIPDEELFATGELEGMLRNEQEREALRPLFQLNWGDDISEDEDRVSHHKPAATGTKRGAKRIDMEVLNRLLTGDDGINEEGIVFPGPDNDTYLCGWDDYAQHSGHQSSTEDAERVDEWRPAPPDHADLEEFCDAAEDIHEEEV